MQPKNSTDTRGGNIQQASCTAKFGVEPKRVRRASKSAYNKKGSTRGLALQLSGGGGGNELWHGQVSRESGI